MSRNKDKLPLRKAFLCIFLATCLISGGAAIALFCYFHWIESRKIDNAYRIQAIVQMGDQKGLLRTVYFAELLGLSIDKPRNLYQLNLKSTQHKLLESPLIKSVELKKIMPGTLLINYSARTPVAFLGDFTNTAIDEEGFLIPFKPFFSPKNLPEIVVGGLGDRLVWGKSLEGAKGRQAISLFSYLSSFCRQQNLNLRKLDIRHADAPTLGKREIVVECDDAGVAWVLRLNVDNYESELERFLAIRSLYPSEIGPTESITRIVNLRLPQLAYILQNH